MFFYNAAKAGLAAAPGSARRGETARHPRRDRVSRTRHERPRGGGAGRVRGPRRDPATCRPAPRVLARMIADAVAKRRPRVVYPRLYGVSRHFPNATRWALDKITLSEELTSGATTSAGRDAMRPRDFTAREEEVRRHLAFALHRDRPARLVVVEVLRHVVDRLAHLDLPRHAVETPCGSPRSRCRPRRRR